MKVAVITPVYNDYTSIWIESFLNLLKIENVSFPLISRGGGSNITSFRNTLIQDLLIYEYKQKSKVDFVLWIDGDIGYTRDNFVKILSHTKDKEIISGLYFGKSAPFKPVAGYYDLTKLSNGFPAITKQDILSKKVCSIDWIGMGFVLMKRSVLDSLDYPWFEMTIVDLPKPKIMEGGLVINKELLSEDISFWKKIKDKGHEIHLDPSILLNHKGTTNFTIDHYLAVN